MSTDSSRAQVDLKQIQRAQILLDDLPMQYDPHQTGSPPKPIEPTGFFTGIQFRPIIAGAVVDFIATFALVTLYYVFYIAPAAGAAPRSARRRVAVAYFESPAGAVAVQAAAAALGGSVAHAERGRYALVFDPSAGENPVRLALRAARAAVARGLAARARVDLLAVTAQPRPGGMRAGSTCRAPVARLCCVGLSRCSSC